MKIQFKTFQNRCPPKKIKFGFQVVAWNLSSSFVCKIYLLPKLHYCQKFSKHHLKFNTSIRRQPPIPPSTLYCSKLSEYVKCVSQRFRDMKLSTNAKYTPKIHLITRTKNTISSRAHETLRLKEGKKEAN